MASIGPSRFDDGVQRVGGVAEALRDLDAVTGDGPSLERGREGRGQEWAVGDDGTGSHLRRRDLGGGRLVEDRPEPRVAAAATGLAGLGRGEGAGDDVLEHPGEGDHPVAAHHLEKAGLVHHRHLRAAGEEHLAAAPPESVTDEVGAERPESPRGPAST